MTRDDEGIVPKRTSETLESEAPAIELGQWYWVAPDTDNVDEGEDVNAPPEPDFCCVTHLGSNFATLTGVDGDTQRILYSEFDAQCTLERDAESVIKARIAKLQGEAKALMAEVQQVSSRLAVSPNPELGAGGTEALARVNETRDMKGYAAELTLAKETTLPELFKQIEEAHKELGRWMAAPTLTLHAQTSSLKSIVKKVDDRILDIGLYAGLVEEVVQVTDGPPAPIDAKLHLLQRRHYMDEECLLAYESGGMDFGSIDAFSEWLARPSNRDRVLPFPRCLVAFRVRRHEKDREARTLRDFIYIMGAIQADESTFLFIRNGESLYRLETAIDFGEKLFPDLDRRQLGGKLWANVSWSTEVREIITDAEYQGIRDDDAKELAAWRQEQRERRKEGRARFTAPRANCRDYVAYSKDNVHYDDITAKIQSDIHAHNRIALIIQGLFDRSPVLHPHLPHKIWTPEGFEAALELIYDESRALVPGPKPDFEAYRARLNQSLGKGSITVGQEDAWARAEAEKEIARRSRDWRRGRSDYEPEKYFPYGNPGPGELAEVAVYSRSKQACTYHWYRERQHYKRGADDRLPTKFTTGAANLLNVSAYTPGDYKQFFADPRTRAEYLKWAPMLLAAEDFHAGTRTVGKASR